MRSSGQFQIFFIFFTKRFFHAQKAEKAQRRNQAKAQKAQKAQKRKLANKRDFFHLDVF